VTRAIRAAVLAAVLTAALAGCGGDSEGDSLQSDADGTTLSTQGPVVPIGPVAPSEGAACASAAPNAGKVSGTTDLSKKPQVEVPDTPPPCNLVVGDVVVGNGAAAKAGDHLTMKYVGITYSTGKQFDASWDRGQDFDFTLGSGTVIQGWDQGLVGMKVGGRRQLIIPPSLGYGDQAQGEDIPANSTLIFVVDLVKIG
jgi:peptidylprolyl isomerase